jgi:hypothetical protein
LNGSEAILPGVYSKTYSFLNGRAHTQRLLETLGSSGAAGEALFEWPDLLAALAKPNLSLKEVLAALCLF